MFIIILLVILIIIYFLTSTNNNTENFYACGCKSKLKKNYIENFYVCPCKSKKLNKYPYNPPISTPQSNYNKNIKKIDSQQTYKKNLSVALSPTPTIHCPELNNLADCNKYGCNWFGSANIKNLNSFCSSTYPIQI